MSARTEAKPDGYYGQGRPDLVARLPRPLGRVLDVGCGEGAAATALRAAGATWIAGIEVHPAAAERAASALDEVVTGAVEDVLHRLSGPFDTLLAYDVLEHLLDPAAVLRSLHTQAAAGARLHVSLPNARHWTLLRDLVSLVGRGVFVQEPSACDFCDFTAVCGPKGLLQRRQAYKVRDRALQDYLRLRDVS